MLSDADRERVRDEFGADNTQIERDHLISHVLEAISSDLPDNVLFYGGTALSRSHLSHGRLSEDIDLIAVGPRVDVADALTSSLTRRLAREFGRPAFTPHFSATRATTPVVMKTPRGPQLQLQLLPGDHYPAWPFEQYELQQRYSDCGPARLMVPTFDAFIAWKTVTYLDRRAARDLWDLAAMAAQGPFTESARRLLTRFGPSRSLPSPATFPAAPIQTTWVRDLAHQTHLSLTAEKARDNVLLAWSRLNK